MPPRRVALISDVHANLVALRAVLAEIDAIGVDEIVSAGDMVGFGPNPDAVIDLLRERRVSMIRGNHEKDYVAPYGTPTMPEWWAASPRLISFRWSLDQLGAERRTFLAALPDRLMLDEATLVVHGSPRHVRDAVLATKSDDELEAMFSAEPARLAFTGHTHRPLIRDLPRRRLVNVGSVGLSLDGDPRAAYVLAAWSKRDGWSVETRRVGFDVAAAASAYDNGLREVDPGYVAIMERTLERGQDYFGPWLRLSNSLPDDELPEALERYLVEVR